MAKLASKIYNVIPSLQDKSDFKSASKLVKNRSYQHLSDSTKFESNFASTEIKSCDSHEGSPFFIPSKQSSLTFT